MTKIDCTQISINIPISVSI